MTNFRRSTADQDGPTLVFASSPEGLVSKGDLTAMARYVSLSGDQAGRDRARLELLQASTNALGRTPESKVMRMKLYGWPVAVSYRKPVRVPASTGMGIERQTAVLLKMRELWARAFGARSGAMISSLSHFTHLNAVLSLDPVLLRDCMRHGVSVLQGTPPPHAWSFCKDPARFESASPELPAVYLFGAFVCWDFNEEEPEVAMPPAVAMELQQLSRALFASSHDAIESVRVGTPQAYCSAVTQGQGLQLVAMLERAMSLGRELGLGYELRNDCMEVAVAYQEPQQEDEPDLVVKWSYNSRWRPSTHVEEIDAMLGREVKRIQETQRLQPDAGARGLGRTSGYGLH